MIHKFELALPEFNKTGKFNLDYVLTANPVIRDGNVDLSFFFDIGAHGDRCDLPNTGADVQFDNSLNVEYMQFVL